MAAARLLHFHRNTPLLSDPPDRLKNMFIHVYSTREYIQKPFPGIANRRMPVSYNFDILIHQEIVGLEFAIEFVNYE